MRQMAFMAKVQYLSYPANPGTVAAHNPGRDFVAGHLDIIMKH